MTKVAYVEWQDGLSSDSDEWEYISKKIKKTKADILITNEMPFGAWRPINPTYNHKEASLWAKEHEDNLNALDKLEVTSIISSRPIIVKDKLVNEAFLLENGKYKTLHQKHFFPAEDGWHEASWFKNDLKGFAVTQVNNLNIGILLCTELMYNEKARHYGQLDADLIVVPRATGRDMITWQAGCAMAAIVSGSYVISSNRTGQSSAETPEFGGHGLAYAPGGEKLGTTTADNPIKTININVNLAKKAKLEYPCYLR